MTMTAGQMWEAVRGLGQNGELIMRKPESCGSRWKVTHLAASSDEPWAEVTECSVASLLRRYDLWELLKLSPGLQ